MPGAGDVAALHLPLVEGPASMAAAVDDGVQSTLVTEQQQRRPGDLCPVGNAFDHRRFLGHRCPLRRQSQEDGVVHPHALPHEQVPTQPGGPHTEGHGDGTEQLPETVTAPPAGQPGEHEELLHGDVAQGVDHAQSPGAATGVGPVGHTGQRGGQRGDQTQPHQSLRSPAAPVGGCQVEQRGAYPGAKGEVGEGRVEGVSQPGSGEEVLARAAAHHPIRQALQHPGWARGGEYLQSLHQGLLESLSHACPVTRRRYP